jgi:hypothetical protein
MIGFIKASYMVVTALNTATAKKSSPKIAMAYPTERAACAGCPDRPDPGGKARRLLSTLRGVAGTVEDCRFRFSVKDALVEVVVLPRAGDFENKHVCQSRRADSAAGVLMVHPISNVGAPKRSKHNSGQRDGAKNAVPVQNYPRHFRTGRVPASRDSMGISIPSN